jgi:hypothetical protein
MIHRDIPTNHKMRVTSGGSPVLGLSSLALIRLSQPALDDHDPGGKRIQW